MSSHAFRTNIETRHLLVGVIDEVLSGLIAHESASGYAICAPPAAQQDKLESTRSVRATQQSSSTASTSASVSSNNDGQFLVLVLVIGF